MIEHFLNNFAQVRKEPQRIVAVDSGDDVRALPEIDLIFVAPLDPLVIYRRSSLVTCSMALLTATGILAKSGTFQIVDEFPDFFGHGRSDSLRFYEMISSNGSGAFSSTHDRPSTHSIREYFLGRFVLVFVFQTLDAEESDGHDTETR